MDISSFAAGRLRASGRWFLDEYGRRVLLRGVNLGGDTKVPVVPDGSTHLADSLADHRNVSFVGRPFPLEDAEEHLGRLRRWGFNCLRLLTTWEAIAHEGPDRFDEAYLDYFTALCRRAGEAGFHVVIDFHQDVFSRMTGGDGAPGWALEAAGLALSAIHPSDAAWLMQHRYDPNDPDAYPRMSWTWNYQMPANGILWSLFFAGERLVPEHTVDGVSVERFLQDQFFRAQRAVAERVADQPWVVGFDVLNEPSRGWLETPMTQRPNRRHGNMPARPGPAFSPLDGLWSAAGHPTVVPWMGLNIWRGGVVKLRDFTANPNSVRLWRDGVEDPFQRAGAWEETLDGPRARQEDFFQQLSFEREGLGPFYRRAARNLHDVRDDWLIFCEKDALDATVNPTFETILPPRAVNATHWYDLVMLLLRRDLSPLSIDPIRLRVGVGQRGITRLIERQLGQLLTASEAAGGMPTFVGEFGIPFDLHEGDAYAKWAEGERGAAVWHRHTRALQRMYAAFDALWLSGAQWNYTASNQNAAHIGDRWNQEDLSIYSPDQHTSRHDPDSGGRAVDGFCRPYARAVQGIPLRMKFDAGRKQFRCEWEADPTIKAPTEIFVPQRVWIAPRIEVRGGRQAFDAAQQRLRVWADRPGRCRVSIRAQYS